MNTFIIAVWHILAILGMCLALVVVMTGASPIIAAGAVFFALICEAAAFEEVVSWKE